jgi:hypothetical protein
VSNKWTRDDDDDDEDDVDKVGAVLRIGLYELPLFLRLAPSTTISCYTINRVVSLGNTPVRPLFRSDNSGSHQILRIAYSSPEDDRAP